MNIRTLCRRLAALLGIDAEVLKVLITGAMKRIRVQDKRGATVTINDLLKGTRNAMSVHTAIVVVKCLIDGMSPANARNRANELASLNEIVYFQKIQASLDTIHAHIANDVIFPPLVISRFVPTVPRRHPNGTRPVSPREALSPLSETTVQYAKKHGIDDPEVVQEALNEAARDPSPDFGSADAALANSIHTFDPVSVNQSRDYEAEAEAEETKADDAVAVIAPVAPPVVPPPSARVRGRARRHRPPTPPVGPTRRPRPDTPHPSPPERRRRARRGATPPFLQSVRRLNFQVAALTRHFDGALAALGICQEEDGHETVESSESEYDPDETLTDEDIKQEK